MKISSNPVTMSAPAERIFSILVGFAHQDHAPAIPQVTNWTTLEDGCQFTVAGMITCSMRLTEQCPFSHLVYEISSDKGISAKATFHIEEAGGARQVSIEADADAPIFLQPMIKKPLEQAMNKGLEKLKEMTERI